MRIPITVATTCLLFAPAVARAGDPGKAGALLKQALAAMDKADCRVQNKPGCSDPAVFPAAMAQIDQALAADTSAPTLKEACRLGAVARGPEFAWLTKTKRVDQVLAWCDAARLAGNHDSNPGDDLRRQLTANQSPAEREAAALVAMRAVFGIGFKVTRDAATDTVSIDYGDIDAAKLEAIVAEQWAPMLYGAQKGSTGRGDDKLYHQGQYGFILLDPSAKGGLCTLLADETSDRKKWIEWCEVEAIKEAATVPVAFRGQAASYTKTSTDRGLRPDDAVLVGRPDGHWTVAITVAGANPADDQAHSERLNGIIGRYSEVRRNRDVAGILARSVQVEKQKRAAYAADEAKHTKRPMVVYATQSFDTWTFPPLLATTITPTCDQVYWKAYSGAKDTGYQLELKVDGTACYGHGLSTENTGHPEGYTDSLANPKDNSEVPSRCPDTLAAPGKHDVVAEIWSMKSGVVGKEVRDGVVQDRYMSGQDKKLGTWRLACVTP